MDLDSFQMMEPFWLFDSGLLTVFAVVAGLGFAAAGPERREEGWGLWLNVVVVCLVLLAIVLSRESVVVPTGVPTGFGFGYLAHGVLFGAARRMRRERGGNEQ